MKTLTFTPEEIEVLKAVCLLGSYWPGCEKLVILDLSAIADTEGDYQKNSERDLLANAVTEALEHSGWPHVSPHLISAARTLAGGTWPLQALLHPPTGKLLKPWLVADQQEAIDYIQGWERTQRK